MTVALALLWLTGQSVADAQFVADGSTVARDRPPHVLLIVADDLGFSDLGCYGSAIRTPNLDALAARGTRFSRFYTMARCCPSRAALLTGEYPHAVGIGHKVADLGPQHPGYRGSLPDGQPTLGDRLTAAGYRCFFSGKWHLGTPDPTRHGFEEYFGTLVSAQSYWDPAEYVRLPSTRERLPEDDFYGTDAITDYALDFLGRTREAREPHCVVVAYNAPHFPLQAPKDLIDGYIETFAAGWDAVRERRLGRTIAERRAVPRLSDPSPFWNYGEFITGANPPWTALPPVRRADLVRRMATYAAMVDRMDQNIGRLLADIDSHGETDDTVVIFLSDNGACAEWDPLGFDFESSNQNRLWTGDDLRQMGQPGTYHSVGSGWAQASNTPFRLFKHYCHEGGLSSPLIVAGPTSLDEAIVHRPTHLIDIVPTLLDLAGQPDAELPGQPLSKTQRRRLFFEHEGNRAVHDGRWKLVALRGAEWELYDMASDRIESRDLAAAEPDLVQRLSDAWDRWAADQQVTPLPRDYGVDYLRRVPVR